jgi:hypothetical protein
MNLDSKVKRQIRLINANACTADSKMNLPCQLVILNLCRKAI